MDTFGQHFSRSTFHVKRWKSILLLFKIVQVTEKNILGDKCLHIGWILRRSRRKDLPFFVSKDWMYWARTPNIFWMQIILGFTQILINDQLINIFSFRDVWDVYLGSRNFLIKIGLPSNFHIPRLKSFVTNFSTISRFVNSNSGGRVFLTQSYRLWSIR